MVTTRTGGLCEPKLLALSPGCSTHDLGSGGPASGPLGLEQAPPGLGALLSYLQLLPRGFELRLKLGDHCFVVEAPASSFASGLRVASVME